MSAIAATSYTSRVLVDGTLAMVIHIDPAQRDAAMRMFGAPGTAMGIAALVRVSQICRDTKTGQPGLLPINRATWYKWVKAGRVPEGRKLGPSTTVWPVEVVLAVGL